MPAETELRLPAETELSAPIDELGLTAAINQAAHAVMITDHYGNILYVNAAFTAVTGYTSEEVLGRSPRILKSTKQEPGYYETSGSRLQRAVNGMASW